MIQINSGVGIYSRAYDFVVPRLKNPPLLPDGNTSVFDKISSKDPERFPYLVETYERLNLEGPKGKLRWHITVFLNFEKTFNVFEYLDDRITQEDVTRIVYECIHQIRPVTWVQGDGAFKCYADKEWLGRRAMKVMDAEGFDSDESVRGRYERKRFWENRVASVEGGQGDPSFIGLKQGNHTGERNHNNGTS